MFIHEYNRLLMSSSHRRRQGFDLQGKKGKNSKRKKNEESFWSTNISTCIQTSVRSFKTGNSSSLCYCGMLALSSSLVALFDVVDVVKVLRGPRDHRKCKWRCKCKWQSNARLSWAAWEKEDEILKGIVSFTLVHEIKRSRSKGCARSGA